MDTLSRLRAGELKGATRLDLACGLTSVPPEVFDLADTLEVLNLTGNHLSELPDELPRLRKLRVLFCSHNRFTHFPAVIGQCQNLSMVGFRENQIETIDEAAFPPLLRWLILTGNRISDLPASIGHCDKLQKLMLSANRLGALPEALSHCQNLEMIRLAANEFEALPEWLFEMPKMAWMALAGNPCTQGDMLKVSVPEIPWDHLSLGGKLGEGASGIIHHARWQKSAEDAPVETAVKIFKGNITSDGLPECEMAACLATDGHPHLAQGYGRISQHPDGALGLVMKLISPEFINLGEPPSLESCTRDVYADGFTIGLPALLKMSQSLASAMEQLHAANMLHGDFYAHNVVWKPDGDCILGDFGAASFYPSNGDTLDASVQFIEVRAFGYLLEELMEKASTTTRSEEQWQMLDTLRDRCLSNIPAERPSFSDLSVGLKQLADRSKV